MNFTKHLRPFLDKVYCKETLYLEELRAMHKQFLGICKIIIKAIKFTLNDQKIKIVIYM